MYLKERLASGQPLIGGGIYSGSSDVIEWAARGLDWIWWDAQHTQGDWREILLGVRAGQAYGIPVLVRTWTHDGGTIERLLDTGAEGIIVPMVDTPEEAATAVARCYYPPFGQRSIGSAHAERLEPDPIEWNRRVVTVMQIETPEGLENADAIAAVPGVDALHLGMRDLALRLGRVADDRGVHALVGDALERVMDACRAHGKAAAVVVSSEEEQAARLRDGYRLICAGMDLNWIAEGWRRMREAARREAQG
jgi:4-hydroxy-2-oxoheptanedioate aldolase